MTSAALRMPGREYRPRGGQWGAFRGIVYHLAIVIRANNPISATAHDKIIVFCHIRTPCGNAMSPTELFLTAFFQEFKHVITDPDFR
ncbi:hypothetical protein [Janthinobacterium sp.]|uniref:hypothetical protein n=1 Tax=Janthinobacterium sp. TaxID=1871054 RepID=UPI00293D9CB1|nr:hypothetical protein [Janthinobacterium sp.]